MGKWTPGPWEVHDNGDGIRIDGAEITLAFVDGDYRDQDYSMQMANARLISLAPEMAEALRDAATLLRLLTVRQIIEGGDDAIRAAGLNPYAMNEGSATGDERYDDCRIPAILAKLEAE